MQDITHEALKVEIDHLKSDVEKLQSTQERLVLELAKYKGMVGGVMLVINCIWVGVTTWLQYFKGTN